MVIEVNTFLSKVYWHYNHRHVLGLTCDSHFTFLIQVEPPKGDTISSVDRASQFACIAYAQLLNTNFWGGDQIFICRTKDA